MVVTLHRMPRARRTILAAHMVVSCVIGALPAMAHAQSSEPTLLDAWLSQPELSERPAPHQYMRGDRAADDISERRAALLKEFEDLSWRLNEAGYGQALATVEDWKDRIASFETFRTPGAWGPAALMASPSKMPPFERVEAIGACLAPDWVEVWDREGIRRFDFRQAQSLSMLLDNVRIDAGTVGRLIVVRPDGTSGSFGAQAWNFHDTTITPGSRVVASLPLSGSAFGWIQDTIADVLAHVPSGVECKEAALVQQDD